MLLLQGTEKTLGSEKGSEARKNEERDKAVGNVQAK